MSVMTEAEKIVAEDWPFWPAIVSYHCQCGADKVVRV